MNPQLARARSSIVLILVALVSAAFAIHALAAGSGAPPAANPATRPVYNPLYPDLLSPPTSISEPHVNTAAIPYPQYYDDALKVSRGNITTFNRLHAQNLARAKQGNIDVVFFGDSITEFWSRAGRPVWQKYFADSKFANFGISADRTQNVLWRLQHGEADGYTPKVVVLQIGTNNLGQEVSFTRFRNTGPEIAEGIKAIITEMQKHWPNVKVLLFGVFPRGHPDGQDKEPMRKYAKEVNDVIANFDDGKTIFYIDLGPQFVDEQGNIKPTVISERALIHPAAGGYEIWAKAVMERLPALGVAATKPAN